MNKRDIHASGAPAAISGYAQAVEITEPTRTLYLSGQIPVSGGGAVPDTFGEQCRLVWRNVEAQLHAAEMTLDNLIKVTTFLSDRKFGDENGDVRRKILGERSPALTVVIAGIYHPAWLLEIEAIAAA